MSVEEPEVVVLSPPSDMGSDGAIVQRSSNLPSEVLKERENLVRDYHDGELTLIERLRKTGKGDQDSLLVALIDEVIQETDHLLGNELVAAHNGELRDASVISVKRAEVLEKAIKAVQAKQADSRSSGMDVNSPQMMVVIRFFMSKAHDAFDKMGVGSEISDLFFRSLGDIMDDWKKELKDKFEELRIQE